MNYRKLTAALFAACMLLLGVACSKVPGGNVGVKYYLLGGDKGLDSEELSPGRYYIGWNEELYLFPTFTQTTTWVGQEAISFQTKEGLNIDAAVGMSYSIDPRKVSTIFEKYKKGIDEITDLYLRNMVRDALVTAASVQSIESVYGEGKATLLRTAHASVKEQVAPLGIVVENLYWIGPFGLPQNVTDAINAKIQATQIAQQRQNEVLTAKAEADKQIEAARGQAESIRLEAEAKAQAIAMEGKALADNPKVIELRTLERWQGHYPSTIVGDSSAVPLIQLPTTK